MKFKWTFQEGLLGTSTANEEIYRNYLASKAPTQEAVDEEVAAIAAVNVDEQFGSGNAECGIVSVRHSTAVFSP